MVEVDRMTVLIVERDNPGAVVFPAVERDFLRLSGDFSNREIGEIFGRNVQFCPQ